MEHKKSGFNWKQKLLVIALMIVTVAFVFTGIYLVFDEANYEDYCHDKRAIPLELNTADQCKSFGGEWVENAYCDLYSECSSAYESERSEFRFKVFVSAFITGSAILLSAIFIPIPIVSAAMMGSGIVTLLISVLGYWEDLGEIWRLVVLGVTLVALIWIAVKKFSN
jgi:hypothetical protein